MNSFGQMFDRERMNSTGTFFAETLDLLAVIKPDGAIIECNPALKEAATNAVLPRSFRELLTEQHRKSFDFALDRILAGGSPKATFHGCLADSPSIDVDWTLARGTNDRHLLVSGAPLVQENAIEELSDALPVGVFHTDSEGKLIHANRTWCELAGCERDQALGASWLNIVPRIERGTTEIRWRSCCDTGQMFEAEFRIPLPDGKSRWLRAKANPHPRIPGVMVGVTTEITRLKDAAALNQQALAVLDASDQAAFIFEPETLRFTYGNQSALRQSGYTAGELLELTPLAISPELREESFREIIAPLLTGSAREQVLQTEHQDRAGKRIPVEIKLERVVLPDGRMRIVQVARDLSERDQARKQIDHQEKRFKAIFNSMFQFIGLLSPDGIVLEANDTALEAGGLTLDDVIGKPFWETHWWSHSEESRERLRRSIQLAARGETVRYEDYNVGVGDRLIPVDFSLKPCFDESGKVIMIIPEGRDITERALANEALELVSTTIAGRTGDEFFTELTVQLCAILGVDIAFVAKYVGRNHERAQMVAFADGGHSVDTFEYKLEGTPCETAAKGPCCYPSGVQDLFPKDKMLGRIQAEAYLALPLTEAGGEVLGHLGIIHREPIGNPHQVLDMLRVIAVRTGAELHRIITEKRFFDLFELAPDAMVMLDESGLIVQGNHQTEKLFGCPREEMTGIPFSRFVERGIISSDSDSTDNQTYFTTVGSRRMGSGNTTFLAKKATGISIPVEISLSPMDTDQGRLVAAAIRDISDRHEMQIALKQERDFTDAILGTVNALIVVLDRGGRIIRFNGACESLTGHKFHEVVGMEFADLLVINEERDQVMDHFRRLRDGDFPNTHTNNWRTNEGERRLISWHNSCLTDARGDVEYVIGCGQDITEMHRTARIIKRDRELFRLFIEYVPAAVAMFDRDLHHLAYSQRWSQDFGLQDQDLIGKHYYDVFPEIRNNDDWLGVHQRALAGQVERRENDSFVRADGRREWLRWEVRPWTDEEGHIGGIIMFMEVITARREAEEQNRRLERQVRQTQKMEALGTLAGGVAHDFNNILGAILGFSQLAQMSAGNQQPLDRYLNQVTTAANRAKDLVSQILAFSRQSENEPKPFDVSMVITEAIRLIEPTTPSSIQIQSNLPDTPCWIKGDPGQIHQVVMNLCTNAFHAMDDGGGTIEIELKDHFVDGNVARTVDSLEPGHYYQLIISDTGHGMDEGTVDRIFDPFFTTKEQGRGTGLGLSVVHGIIRGHDGRITVYSKPGVGTSFNIILPAIDTQVDLPGPATEEYPHGFGERILFIDDEDLLTTSGQITLEHLGYEVVAHTNPTKAWNAFKDNPDNFDLVISDLDMPKLNGREIITRIRTVRPDIPVILSSGYIPDKTRRSLAELNINAFLRKPNSLRDIADTVHQVLLKSGISRDPSL